MNHDISDVYDITGKPQFQFTPAFEDTDPGALSPEFISGETRSNNVGYIVIESSNKVKHILEASFQDMRGYTSIFEKACWESLKDSVSSVQIIMTVGDLVRFTLLLEYFLPDIGANNTYKEIREKLSISLTFKDSGQQSPYYILYGLLLLQSKGYHLEGIGEGSDAVRNIIERYQEDPNKLNAELEKLKIFNQCH